jgi:integrase
MELAVAIAVLLVAPMRRSNLASLRLDRHLVRPGGPLSAWLIEIPPEEVKNEVPLLYELSQRVTTVVNRHIRDFRPMRAQPGNPYLFPVGSTHKSPAVLSAQIKRVIADWVGIDMTPHQFRHLAGFLMQKHRPGSLAALAQLLGHDIRTTLRYYAELDTVSAGREFDEIIEAEIAKARRPRPRRS